MKEAVILTVAVVEHEDGRHSIAIDHNKLDSLSAPVLSAMKEKLLEMVPLFDKAMENDTCTCENCMKTKSGESALVQISETTH